MGGGGAVRVGLLKDSIRSAIASISSSILRISCTVDSKDFDECVYASSRAFRFVEYLPRQEQVGTVALTPTDAPQTQALCSVRARRQGILSRQAARTHVRQCPRQRHVRDGDTKTLVRAAGKLAPVTGMGSLS